MAAGNTLQNYINNEWLAPDNSEYLDVMNPATTDVLAKVPLSPAAEVDIAAQAAASALTIGGIHRRPSVYSTCSN